MKIFPHPLLIKQKLDNPVYPAKFCRFAGKMSFCEPVAGTVKENGYEMICSTVRHLVKELQEALPHIGSLSKPG